MRINWLVFLLVVPWGMPAAQLSDQDSRLSDSLSHIVRFTKSDTLKANTFLALGRLHHGAMPDRAMYFYQRAIDACYGGLRRNLATDEELSFLESLSSAMNNLSTIYRARGDVRNELELSLGSLKIKQYLGDELMIGRSLYNISETFLSLHDTLRSLEYLKRSIYFFTRVENQKGLAYSYYKIGKIFMAKGDTGEALRYYNMSLDIETRTGDDYGKASTLNSLSQYYLEMGKFEQAFKLCREALRINQELNDQRGLLNSLYNMGKIELRRNNLTAAHRYAIRGLEIAQRIQYLNDIQEGSLLISEILEAQGKFEEAYYYFGRYASLHDSLIVNEGRKNIVKSGIQDDFRKEALKEKLLNDNQILLEKERRENEELYTWIVLLAILLLSILSFWTWSRYRLYKRQKVLIENQTQKIRNSIQYSAEVQHALIPGHEILNEHFVSAFTFHQPVHIVSGDFYWFRAFATYYILVCVDCKGHGVDGGFRSTVGTLLLDRIIQENNCNPESMIVEFVDRFSGLIPGGEFQKPDISVCIIYPSDMRIDFASLNCGIVIVSGREVIQYPSVGPALDGFPAATNLQIKKKKIEIDAGDWIFLHTDGALSQVGGKTGELLGWSRFEKMLRRLASSENWDKSNLLRQQLHDWMGANIPADDTLVIGVKI